MKTLLIIFALLISIQVMARDGSSGCGPGWYVFKENSLVSSVLRSTTNGILFPTTTIGMTLGTSNCTKHKLVLTEKEAIYYTAHNYYELKSEAAKGSGEFLSGLSEVIGCRPDVQEIFNQKLKSNYNSIFQKDNANDSLKEIYKIIILNKKLVRSCSLG